jgi:hypothetical protein
MFLKINIIEGLDTKECNVLKLKTCHTLAEPHIVWYLPTFCFSHFKPLYQIAKPVAHANSAQLNSKEFTT